MFRKRTNFLVLTVLFVSLLVGGYAGCAAAAPAAKPALPENLSIGTAGASGTYYLVGGALANLINKELGIKVTAEATAGAGENLQLMDDKKIEFALLSTDQMDLAVDGKEPFTKAYDVKTVYPLYPNIFQVLVPAESSIKTMQDLRGKRVSVGSPGSGLEIANRDRLEAIGITYRDFRPEYITLADNKVAMSNGNIDAALMETSAPTAWAIEYESEKPLRAIALTDEEVTKMHAHTPAAVPVTMLANSYKSVTQEIKTAGTYASLCVRGDISDEVVYEITRVITENLAELQAVHAAMLYLQPKNIEYSPIDLHPGAVKYFKEIGILPK